MPTKAPPVLSVLTPRESEVLSLVADGLRNSEIAARIGVTEGTVKGYLGGIRSKLGTSSRPVLADIACRAGHQARPKGAEVLTPKLSETQTVTLRLLARGAGARDIAKAHLVSQSIAKKHIRHLLNKMGASDAAHGVSLAWSWRILQADEGVRSR
ncbi:LuxR C-terminal-related transcriptional regulator [Streptomyces sp. NPDC057555]|uniref:LuxR C-terminal-related transcriptional regulator n=1 Tax=Streptomyces sp. NPDC057555 TaxID=3346166 RepID=UPI00368A9123